MERGLSRRRLLRATFAGGVAGAGVRSVSTTVAGRQESSDSWPMFKSDAVNSGHDASGTGPTGEIEQQWTFEAESFEEAESSAVVADGTVFIADQAGTLHAISSADGSRTWSFDAGSEFLCTPAVVDGTVYVADERAAYALGTEDGSQRWVTEINAGPSWSPVLVEGTVFITTYEAQVFALDASDGSEEWTSQSNAPIFSGPAVTSGTVYVSTIEGTVVAFDASDGSQRWSVQADEPFPTSPAVLDDTLYVTGDEGTLYAFTVSDGSEKWTFQAGQDLLPAPTVTDDAVYVGNSEGEVHSLDGEGRLRWQFVVESDVRSSASVVGETLYIGTGNGTLYGVDMESADEQWRVETDSAISPFSSLAVAGGSIYVPTDSGVWYSFAGQSSETPTTVRTATPTPATSTTVNTATGAAVTDVSGSELGTLGGIPVRIVLSMLAGGSVLAASFLGVQKFRGSDGDGATTTTTDTSVADIWDEAEAALSTATDAESDGDYTEALDEYSRGIRACERALESLPDGDERRGEIAAVLKRAREERENLSQAQEKRAELVDTLETAETHFQTAVAAPASDKIVIPRERYRQARNAYDDALDTLNELDMTVLENGVSVSPDPTVDPPPERLNEFPGVHPGAQDALAEEGLETVTELRNAEAETLEVLREHDEIGDRLGVRLAGLNRWHGGDPVTFPDREAIERRRDLAQEAYQAHRQ